MTKTSMFSRTVTVFALAGALVAAAAISPASAHGGGWHFGGGHFVGGHHGGGFGHGGWGHRGGWGGGFAYYGDYSYCEARRGSSAISRSRCRSSNAARQP